MSDVKDRIAAIDAQGREIANHINEAIVGEELVGQSPATIRRVEELIEEIGEINGVRWEFAIMKGGLAAAPLVTVARYKGRVGP